jgi:hypothetical protein
MKRLVINLVTSPSIIFLAPSKTVCNLDFIGTDFDNGSVELHVMLRGFHSKELDECKSP